MIHAAPTAAPANAHAVIMAGGRGERFWPLSRAARPKQFVDLFGGKPLIRHAAERLEGVVAPDHVFVVTSRDLVPATRKALPALPPEQIVGEPVGRDTAAACALATELVAHRAGSPDAPMAILTAGPPRILRMISTPTRMRSARSSITRKSAVRYGSHSAPFRTRYSQRLFGGGLSLTAVGKPAPPMPQMPACSTRLSSSSREAVFQSSGGRMGDGVLTGFTGLTGLGGGGG